MRKKKRRYKDTKIYECREIVEIKIVTSYQEFLNVLFEFDTDSFNVVVKLM